MLGDDAITARGRAQTGDEWDQHQADAELWNVGYLAATGVAGAALVGGVVLLVGGDGAQTQATLGPGGVGLRGTFSGL